MKEKKKEDWLKMGVKECGLFFKFMLNKEECRNKSLWGQLGDAKLSLTQ